MILNRFLNFKVRTKLMSGFLLVALIAGLIGGLGMYNIQQMQQADEVLYHNMTVPISEMSTISTTFEQIRGASRSIVLANTPEQIQTYQNDIIAAQKTLLDTAAQFRETILSDTVMQAYDTFIQTNTEYTAQLNQIVALALENRDAEATTLLLTKTNAAGLAVQAEQDAITALVNLKVADAAAASESNVAQAQRTMVMMIGILLFALLLSLFIGFYLSGAISKPLNRALLMIQEMSKGHLGMRLQMNTKDEVGQMAAAMDNFAEYLQNTVIHTVTDISEGKLDANIPVQDEQDEISPALNNTMEIIRSLLRDTEHLIAATQEGKLDTRGQANDYTGSWSQLVTQINALIDAFVAPINVTAEYIDRISSGDIPPKITDEYKGDFNEIKNNLNSCIDTLNSLVADTDDLVKAAVDGKLDTRADATKHSGDYARIVDGINQTLDAVIGPLNVAAEYVDRISKGNIPPKITDDYKGDFNEIKNNLNSCIDTINSLVTDTERLITATQEGKLDTRGQAEDYTGSWSQLVTQINALIDAFVAPINVTAEYIDRISSGDIPPKITDEYKGDFNEIKNNLNSCIDTLNSLVADTDDLVKAAVDGKLDTRADATKHSGDYARIVDGINQTLDAVIGPLNVAAEYVDRISKGNIPPKITDDYKGDFNEIKNNLNSCIDTINSLVTDTERLITATQEGKLDTRGQAEDYTGSWSQLVTQINALIDAFVAPINVTAEYIDRISSGDIPPKITDEYKGDFNEIKNNLNSCIDTLNSLVADTDDLVKAAVDGKLDARADATKHSGDYARIVDGINRTLDAITTPVKEASDVLHEMFQGNLQLRVKGDYHGDHAEIKNALNNTLDLLTSYITEVSNVLTEMSHSNLQVAITAEYKGDFYKMKEALNLIIHSFNDILQDIGGSANQVAQVSAMVSEGSQSLSQGSTEQASSLEQLSTTIDQFAQQTKQTAMDSNNANALVLTSQKNATDGNAQMEDMLKAMEDINEASSNISKIIKVIEDIAFKTNILALNAAVEAARAGAAGKGFAVVADEVRNLASKSTSAAQETTVLIESTMNKVAVGFKIANETADKFSSIVNDVSQTAEIVSSIAESSNEQEEIFSQINQGISQLSIVVQANTATAEESAAASEELSAQAESLKNMLDVFKLQKKSAIPLTSANNVDFSNFRNRDDSSAYA